MSEPVGGRIDAGDVVGGFVIEAIAGRGGMGVVYRARQSKPDRLVALKVIAPELAHDPAFRARFERESAIAAQIEHPSVIPVHAVGEDAGVLFIAMRFIAGIDLRTLIVQEGRLEPRRAAAIIDQVAQALDAAHSHGLVHRDIKPANILLSTGGGRDHVYLTDFGLSRHVEGSQAVTGTGAFLGTIDYVAPEQAQGERVDARTDVYSLGCVLFHALSGTVPFPLVNDLAKLYAHGTQPPPSVCERAPEVPEAFEPVLMRAMAKTPDERYLSAGDLGRASLAASSNVALPRAETSVAVGDAAPLAANAIPTQPRPRVREPTPPEPPSATRSQSPAGRAPTGRRRRAVWGLGPLISVAAIGAVLFLSGGNSSHRPPKPTSFRGFVLHRPSVGLQQGPALAARVLAELPYGTVVNIVCTSIGDPVLAAPTANVPAITTPVWDKVRTDRPNDPVGFVSDAWIDTGTTHLVAPACNPTPTSGPPVRGLAERLPNLVVQAGPTGSAPVTGHLAYRTAVDIVCTAIGDPVTGPPLGARTITTPVWDKIRTVRAPTVRGYVPDVWVNTGVVRPVAPAC